MLCAILYIHTYTFLFSARAFCSFNQSKHESFTFTSREVAHNSIYLGNNIFYFCLCSILQCVLVHFCTDEFSSTILADAMMTVIIRNITRVCIKWIHSTQLLLERKVATLMLILVYLLLDVLSSYNVRYLFIYFIMLYYLNTYMV